MAAIPYWSIREEIAEILRANLTGITIEIEKELEFGIDQSPWVGIYLERREAPADQQPIAAGRVTRMFLEIHIWVFVHAFDLDLGIKGRDELIGKIELILMANRLLNETVDSCWLDGGELISGQREEEKDFLASGQIVLRMEVSARVTD